MIEGHRWNNEKYSWSQTDVNPILLLFTISVWYEMMSEKKCLKIKIPKAFTRRLVDKRNGKKKKEGREVKIKEGKKENKMVYGKKANGTSILLIIDYKALTTMSNNY